MTKRCIGIDIGRSHVRAVQIARTPEGLLIERTCAMQTRRHTDSLPEILPSLLGTHGFDRHADLAVSMPAHAVFLGQVQTDATGLQALEAGRPSLLQDDLPIPAEDSIIRVCSARTLPSGACSVLLAATSRELLREQLELLSASRLRPTIVDAPIVAMYAAVALNHPEMTEGRAFILYVDESIASLAVTEDGDLLIARNIPLPSDPGDELSPEQIAEMVAPEIEITWRRLFGTDPDANLCIFVVSAPDMADDLARCVAKKTDCRTVIVDPDANIRRCEGVDVAFPICIAEGLAVRALSSGSTDGMDLLAAYNARVRPGRTIRKDLAVCAALLVATALAWLIGLFLQRSCLESEYAHLKDQIHEAFRQALPEEKNIVDPLAQLQQKLDASHKSASLVGALRFGQLAPLEIIHALTVRIPAEGNLRFSDLLIAADSVQAMGACDSFAVLSQWQRDLETIEAFNSLAIQNQQKDAQTGRVHFTLSMSSARME